MRLSPARSRDPQAVDHLIAPAVIAAADLDDPFLTGENARQANRTHHRFGPRAQHPEHLTRGNQFANQRRQLLLILVKKDPSPAHSDRAVPSLFAGPAHSSIREGSAHPPAKNRCSDSHPHPSGAHLRLIERQRKRIVERQVVLHAAGNHPLRLLREHLRSLAIIFKVTKDLLHLVPRIVRGGCLRSSFSRR